MMAYISQSAIRIQLKQIKQSLYYSRWKKPGCIFITCCEELEEAKKKYGKNLDGVIVLSWNLSK